MRGLVWHPSCLDFFRWASVLRKISFIDLLQGACVKKLSGKGKLDDSRATKQIVSLLSAPLEKYNDIETALKLSNYPRVMEHLDNGTNKVMAGVIIQSIMKNRTSISTSDKVCFIYNLVCSEISENHASELCIIIGLCRLRHCLN